MYYTERTNYYLAQMDKTTVWTCGKNDYQQLGIVDDELLNREGIEEEEEDFLDNTTGEITTLKRIKKANVPVIVSSLMNHKIVQVSCGLYHTTAISSQGKVFTWGMNIQGQLGLGDNISIQEIPREVTELEGIHIIKVVCGGSHTAAISKSNALYMFGLNCYGQLGLGDNVDRFLPALVEYFDNVRIIDIDCGENHTACITSKHKCYTWGLGDNHQLGHETILSENKPRRVDFFNDMRLRMKSVSCGYKHTISVTDEGNVYVWGTGVRGEIGLGSDITYAPKPTLIEALASITIREVVCTEHFTGAISDLGELWVFGGKMLGSSGSQVLWLPKRIPLLQDYYVVSLKTGAHHCMSFVDTGELGRNRIIGRILSISRAYVRNLGLIVRIISPYAEQMVGKATWDSIVGNIQPIYDYHRKKVIKKLDSTLAAFTPSIYCIGQIFLDLLQDSRILRLYTEYGSGFSTSWERYLSCLKMVPNLSSFIQTKFGDDTFSCSGLLKNQNSEQLYAFLNLPTAHFSELTTTFEELLKYTPESTEEFGILKTVIQKLKESESLVKGSLNNSQYLLLLDFVRRYPQCQNVIQSHRRFIFRSHFSITEKGAKTYTIYIFNDLLIITHGSEVEHQFPLNEVFIKDLKGTPKPVFIIHGPNQTYKVYVESRKKKLKLLEHIENAIVSWMHINDNRTLRITTGIQILLSDLDQVLPLVSKGWNSNNKKESPRDSPSNSISMSLQNISDSLNKVSLALKNEEVRQQRITASYPTKSAGSIEIGERIIVQMDLGNFPKGKSYSTFSKTFMRRRFHSSSDIILTNSGPVRTLALDFESNYKLSIRITPDTRIRDAKKLLYQASRDSPWGSLVQFQLLEDYILRIKSLNFYLINEEIPIGRVPIISAVYTTAFVFPVVELVLKPKEIVNKVNVDAELQIFEDISVLIGNMKPIMYSHTDELSTFRHLAAGLREYLFKEKKKQRAIENIYPQYRFLESLPIKLPTKLQLIIYIPYINNEKYIYMASPDDTIDSVYEAVFKYIYKLEKHKTREKLKKFMKNIIETGEVLEKSDSSDDTNEDVDIEYKDVNDFDLKVNNESPIESVLDKEKSESQPGTPKTKRKSWMLGDIISSGSKKKLELEDSKEQSHGSKRDETTGSKDDNETNVSEGDTLARSEDDIMVLDGGKKMSKKEEERLKKMKKEEEKKLRKEEERIKKEQKKAIKYEKKIKKEDKKLKKTLEKKKKKHLHKGKTIDDFVIKVYGSNEYMLPGNENSVSRLCDYDYICRCIANFTNIELKFMEKTDVVQTESNFETEIEECKIDSSIARHISENEVFEIYLENNSSPPRPFWALSDDTTSYKIRIIDCEDLITELDKAKMNLFIQVGLFYGGRPLEKLYYTNFVSLSKHPVFDEELTFQTKTCNLPRETRLSITIFARSDTNNVKPKVYSSDVPIGWINCLLFDHKSEIKKGLHSLRTWKGRANIIGSCSENNFSSSPAQIFLELYVNGQESPGSIVKKKRTKKELSRNITIVHEEPNKKDRAHLIKLIEQDSLVELEDEDKSLLWKYQNWCKKRPESLPKLLLSVDWGNRFDTSIIYQLLREWPVLHPITALELLDYKYPDKQVRTFAVRCLESMTDNDVYRLLIQFIQATKYESYHYSALANFLIRRSFADPNRIGHFLFWHIKSEMSMEESIERCSLLLECYIKCCSSKMRKEFLAQTMLIDKIHRIAVDIKSRKGSLTDRTSKLRDKLRKIQCPESFRYPLNPRLECFGIDVESCRVLGSKTAPLWITFNPSEKGAEPIQMIYKVGDDLRQDALTLQIITLMDDLWKREGLDMRLKPYTCLALSPQCGLIEIVKNSNTTSNINIEYGGLRAVYNDSTLLKWLQKHNPTEKAFQKAVENFIMSCAGYSVITFVLGFADRHNDNIMLTKQGHLFHIDFGHFLGNYRKVLGKYVDKTDLVFIDQYYAIIGKDNFNRFEEVCCQAYNVIRKHANYFITLFSLMLSCDLPELQTPNDIEFIKDRLQLNLSNEEADEHFREKLQESRENSTIQLNHAFHVVYHGMKS